VLKSMNCLREVILEKLFYSFFEIDLLDLMILYPALKYRCVQPFYDNEFSLMVSTTVGASRTDTEGVSSSLSQSFTLNDDDIGISRVLKWP